MEPDSGVESICRIFETINSTGTKLTTFDLAVARFYPEPDLRELWQDAQEKYLILKDFEVDGERILQVLYLVTATRNERYRYIEPTRSNLMSLKVGPIKEEWEKSSESLAKIYEFAKAQGARPETLPRPSLLVSLAAVRSLVLSDNKGTDPLDSRKNHDLIRRWYFSKVMQPSRSEASNYQISRDFQVLLKYARNGERPEFPQVILNEDIVLKLKSSDVRYKALQNILATTIHKDLISGKTIDLGSRLHDHHIFPKNASKKHRLQQPMLDSICNRLPILDSSNLSLGEGYPKTYFKDIVDNARKEGTLGDLGRRMDDCLIPHPHNFKDPQWADRFSINQFTEFCQKRAKLIVERVREIVGDSLQASALSGDESMEDNED